MSALPATLVPWQESLAALDARLALSLGPMLHVLDDLVGRLDTPGGATGEPDGYDGTTNRGDFSRLLIEEWLLADEIPVEFLRRAAENELHFLRRAYLREAPTGRVVAFVDTGPEQLGPGRLVQLAALIVLHRRATASGAELVVRLLTEDAPSEGGLPELLSHWLRARTSTLPTRGQVEAAFESADRDDHIWLLAGPSTRALVPTHRRTVSSRVTQWCAEGVSEVTVSVADATARLAVPEPKIAVAALRGQGLFRRPTEPTLGSVPTTGRGAVFGSVDARLLWRGSDAGEVYGCFVGGNDASRAKRYRFNGTVVAAASLGKRLVAAVTDGTGLWIQVVGKKLARVERIHVPLAELGISQLDLARIQTQPLEPLYLQGGRILIQGADGWFALDEDTVIRCGDAVTLAPGAALDAPREAHVSRGEIRLGPHRWAVADLAAGPLLGRTAGGPDAGTWCAWSEDTRVWRIACGPEIVAEIGIDEGDRVRGICVVGNTPSLIVVSPSGRILRQVSPKQVRTWTRWAGPAHFSIHPTRPWLARTTDDLITVGDLASGNTLLEIRAGE